MNLAAVLIRLKFRKKEQIAQNHIAVFSPRFYHILTCIYTVFSHDKAHILKFRTLAFFHKRNFLNYEQRKKLLFLSVRNFRTFTVGLNEIYVWFLLHTKKLGYVGREIIKFCYNI